MTALAKTKSDQLFEDISHWFFSDKKPDAFTLARMKSEVNKLLKVNAAEGYGLLGMLACLEVDVEQCKKNYELAITLIGGIEDYVNYVASLRFLGLSNEAYQQLVKALKIYPHNPEAKDRACGHILAQLKGFRVTADYHLQVEVKASDRETAILQTEQLILKLEAM